MNIYTYINRSSSYIRINYKSVARVGRNEGTRRYEDIIRSYNRYL